MVSIVSGLLPMSQLIMRAKAVNIIQRCIAQEFQGNVVIDSRYCPGLGLEKSWKNSRAKMRVLIIALALDCCPSLLLLCLGLNYRLCPDFRPGMLLRLCPFPSPWSCAFSLALGYWPCPGLSPLPYVLPTFAHNCYIFTQNKYMKWTTIDTSWSHLHESILSSSMHAR